MKSVLFLVFSLFSFLLVAQVSFDDGVTFYSDSTQARLCQGKYRTFYPGFKIRSSTTYKDGKLNGEKLEYYENGQLRSQLNYLNGALFGESIEYYPETQQIKFKYNFMNNLRHGLCITYDEQGNITEEVKYINGEAVAKEPVVPKESETTEQK